MMLRHAILLAAVLLLSLSSTFAIDDNCIVCTNVPTERMIANGKECNAKTVRKEKKCNNSKNWSKNVICQLSCFEAGRGYEGDVCCVDGGPIDTDAPVPSPTPPPTEPPVPNPTDDKGVGEWGPLFDMKLIPIHSLLLPDGNVLSYGTDNKGNQRGDLYYQVWDTAAGAVTRAHKLLQHFTETDIFCSTINVDPSTANIILIGGDTRTPDGFGINTVLEFNSKTYEVRHHPLGNMEYARWYGTSINLPNGDIFVIGGKSEDLRGRGSPIPELWSPGSGFKSLDGAEVPAIAEEPSNNDHWWYPYCYVNSSGEIICILPSRGKADVYRIGVEEDGSIDTIGRRPFDAHVRSPSVMFRIDQVLFVDTDGGLWVADISGSAPVWTKKANLGSGSRANGCFVLMPDGRVAIVGGADTPKGTEQEDLDEAFYFVEIWDPTTNDVVEGPSQELARLYHSTALILPDGSVLSQGGGAPGPLKNRNGQVYFPDYLSGEEQERPDIVACPRNIATDDSFVITVDDATAVEKVTATKSGGSTHARNVDTRWIDLKFEVVNDEKVRVLTEGKNTMIPGLWMINTINSNGVPSVGSLVGVDMVPL